MDSFQDGNWNILDYSIIEEAASTDFIWNNQSCCLEFDVSPPATEAQEKGCTRKRGRSESCNGPGSKAGREKMRRDRMNDRRGSRKQNQQWEWPLPILIPIHPESTGFLELSSILEPGKPPKTDKSAILNDAMRVLNELKAEAEQLKDANEKLQEDIKFLKIEKNELREEKLLLKAEKEKMEQQVESMTVLPAGFVPPPPVAYHAGVNKMMAFPSYGGIPMWQWMPPAAHDTSQDHVLRPPVA